MMNVFGPKTPENNEAKAADPPVAATPDYGTLGPGSDFAKSYGDSSAASPSVVAADPDSGRRVSGSPRVLRIVAMMGGIVSALLVSSGGGPLAAWQRIAGVFSLKKHLVASSARYSMGDLEREKPQKQAETLLARAVSRSDGATDQIQARVESWRGRIRWNSELSNLTMVALNSSDQSVRASGIEVQLAAYGLAKNESTLDALVREADSSDHARKIWALWVLGLLANRGVEPDRVVRILTAHLQGAARDADEDSRHWAVEGLALVGIASTIAPLLEAMHNDPSGLVRERAACSLAESGMLTHEERMTAVPQLISYLDDPALDAQTHAWAFRALADITKQRLPNDAAAWHAWYQKAGASGQ